MAVELIIKYSGDILAAAERLQAIAEILSENFAILTVDEQMLPHLNEYKEIEYIEWPKGISLNIAESSYHACIPQAQAAYGLTGKGVIAAFIDSGIDYTHPDFINTDGSTRIVRLWDMGASGAPPSGFKSGHLYSSDELNKALNSANPLSVIPQIDTIGHGTAVAAVAAGNGRSASAEKGAAYEADIVAVKLSRGGNVNSARTIELMRALKFISDTAYEMHLPCAVNISFGTNEGAHDGSSLFEQYVDEIAGKTGISIVVAAGNEGSSGHHFSANLPTGFARSVEFAVSGGISAMYIVMWKDFVDDFTLELISPTGSTSGIVRSADKEKMINMSGTKVYINMGQPTHYNVDQEIFIQMMGVMEGNWRLNIVSISSVVGDFHIWLPTLEEVGRGTAFARPTTDATITMPATAQDVISVGAYDAARDAIAEFSGHGFIPEYSGGQGRIKPDIVAPGVNVLSAAAGGGYDAFSGTSIAAPFVTGAAVLMMEWGIIKGNDPGMYGQRLKAYLRLGASRTAGRDYPNEIWGYGRLCVKASIDAASGR